MGALYFLMVFSRVFFAILNKKIFLKFQDGERIWSHWYFDKTITFIIMFTVLVPFST